MLELGAGRLHYPLEDVIVARHLQRGDVDVGPLTVHLQTKRKKKSVKIK